MKCVGRVSATGHTNVGNLQARYLHPTSNSTYQLHPHPRPQQRAQSGNLQVAEKTQGSRCGQGSSERVEMVRLMTVTVRSYSDRRFF